MKLSAVTGNLFLQCTLGAFEIFIRVLKIFSEIFPGLG